MHKEAALKRVCSTTTVVVLPKGSVDKRSCAKGDIVTFEILIVTFWRVFAIKPPNKVVHLQMKRTTFSSDLIFDHQLKF